ncbi:hypothetical protein ACNYS0_20285 [Streptomyces sp. BH034]|uniref:hypothetical protein n=1 Tax=Streptomyces sp. BH034 TaxID=3402626 RepID=UPI003BB4BE77
MFETSGGSVAGPNGEPGSGPITGRLYACRTHADELDLEDAARRPTLPRLEAIAPAVCAGGLLAALILTTSPVGGR